ncbi:hypothetical protein STENM36S_02750 [Streptomyces tendae]
MVRSCSALAPALLMTARDWFTAARWVAADSAASSCSRPAFSAARSRECWKPIASRARAATLALSPGVAMTVWATRHPSGSPVAMRSRVTSKNARAATRGRSAAQDSAASYLSP